MLLTRPEQLRIDLPLEAIARVCQKYGVSELAVFGSVLCDDFDPRRRRFSRPVLYPERGSLFKSGERCWAVGSAVAGR